MEDVARELLVEALGRQSNFWGMGKIAGELYAVLYTAPEPLTLSDIAEALGVTKGNVSVAIRRLEELGMVQRRYRRGDRRVFFHANPEFWDIARGFLRRRHQPEFAASFRLVEESLEAASDDFVKERLSALKSFYDTLDRITEVLGELSPQEWQALADTIALFRDARP